MSVTENVVDFNHFEREIFRSVCVLGCETIREALEQYDVGLSVSRDKSIYRYKDLRKTTLKTVMGEIEYRRAMYEEVLEDGTVRYVYLLDEALGIQGSGFMSGLLSEMIAKAACEGSYRAAARSVSELTGQTISHTAAWNVVQQLGERVDAQEQEAAALAARNEGKGTLEAELLFEEMDGIFLSLQGKSRKEHGKSKEMKVAIAYDGAEKTGKNRYRLTNKVATANFEGAKRFRLRKEGTIAAAYNVDEIDNRFVNGDGAGWINETTADESVHIQLDPFHRNKAITGYVADPEARKVLLKLLYSKQIDLLLEVIEAYANSTEDEKERENYLKLHSYFQNNKKGLIPCHRRGLKLPEPPEGKVYRHMGAMESNIFTIIGNRMKGGRECWSINGGNNLARLLCLKTTGKLAETLSGLSPLVLPERYAEEIEVGLSAAKVPQREGKGYNGFKQMLIPSSMPWMKGLAAPRSLC
jgi:GNAT superfamily N-acetyltransferase